MDELLDVQVKGFETYHPGVVLQLCFTLFFLIQHFPCDIQTLVYLFSDYKIYAP